MAMRPGPSPPGDGEVDRRSMVLAGYRRDQATAESGLTHPDPPIRAAALGALDRMNLITRAALMAAMADGDPRVRRRALSLAAQNHEIAAADLAHHLGDTDPSVGEVAAWALGERGTAAADGPDGHCILEDLSAMASGHDDPLCREAAVAALGAIGHPLGLDAILAAAADRPAVRRRAVIALAGFEGTRVDAALARAATDRDWQVRQAAEDLLVDRSPDANR
ncbi:MAG: HEAT repeat domain-containing protein [Acidimicrobiales bacterium]